MITLNGASIAWASKMIPSPSMSSAESETAAAVMLVKEILSARLLLWELGYGQPGSTTLCEYVSSPQFFAYRTSPIMWQVCE